MHYPVSAGRYVNLVAFPPADHYTTELWTATATIGEFGAEFAGWDSRLTGLIEAAGTPGRWRCFASSCRQGASHTALEGSLRD
jgi:hypothetical protein